MHCTAHVGKLILEAAQVLCTVVRAAGGDAPYRSSHAKHPLTVWAGASKRNAQLLCDYALALNAEGIRRGRKHHKSADVCAQLDLSVLPDVAGSTPPQCVGAYVLQNSEVMGSWDALIAAYRAYFNGTKQHLACWKNAEVPGWFIPAQNAA